MLRAFQDSFLSLLLPQPCQTCSSVVEQRADGIACSTCWESTHLFDPTETLCEKCGAVSGDDHSHLAVLCHRCNEHAYLKARALGVYEKALAATVIDLKHRPFIPERLKSRARSFLDQSDVTNVDVIIPIPLAVQRHQERGFNQAETIAILIGEYTGLPVDTFSLARRVHTPLHRGGMDQKARELTVRKAFVVTRPRLIHGKRVLLVDDVLTSGSTASACASVLLKSGALYVNVFTLARAVFR
jgi:ComF family protein